MTKDRRLGRGLAALLGTPLEEDGILEGNASQRPAASALTPAGRAVASDRNAPDKNSTERSSSEKPAATTSSTANRSSALIRNSAVHSEPTRTSSPSDEQGNRASSPVKSSAAEHSGNHLKLHTAESPSAESSSNESTSAVTTSKATTSVTTAPGGVTGSVPLSASGAAAKRDTAAKASSEVSEPNSTTIHSLELNVSEIDNNPFQPRRRFNETEIASLAESIREHEQLQPILVRRVGRRYQLISGERRLRATIHAGLTTIRAEVREADDRLVAELAIVENLQRKDLDAIEKAMSFRRYIDEHNCRQEELAQRLKIDRSTIANLMRLLELPTEIQTWVQNEKLTAGHARALLPLGDESQQLEFARTIMEETWTVRETERRVTEQLLAEDGKPLVNKSVRVGPRKRATPHLATLEQQMRLSLGTKVEIRQNKSGRGKIVVDFANAEEFERLQVLICPQVAKKVA